MNRSPNDMLNTEPATLQIKCRRHGVYTAIKSNGVKKGFVFNRVADFDPTWSECPVCRNIRDEAFMKGIIISRRGLNE